MGVTLYKDMLRWLNEQLYEGAGCRCVEQGYPNRTCVENRIAMLERKDRLELMILKQLGWA